MRYQEVLTFPVVLDRDGVVPLREQLAGQIAQAIAAGSVVSGTRMPSVRTLAEQLGISRGVVVAAYDILHGQGRLEIRRGAGAYVQGGRFGEIDLTPGPAGTLPIRAWRAAWHNAGLSSLSCGEAEAALRSALAGHFARVRGELPATHEIVVTVGVAAGLRLALEAIGCAVGAVAVEEPAALELSRAVAGCVPLGRGGPDGLPAGVRAVVVSPDGSQPAGRILSGRDRLRLAEWARGGGYIVEMAQDAVFRRDLGRLPRLIDTGAGARVIVVGGFEGVLSPALKIGYVVAPREVARAAAELLGRRPERERPGHMLQLVAAHLIAGGALVRHMHRLTRLHTQKRSIVDSILPVYGQSPCTALCAVPDGMTTRFAASAAAGRGIGVQTLDRYYFGGRPPGEQALVLGYSHLADNVLRHGLTRLRQLLRVAAG